MVLQKVSELGLYIHTPFCLSKCNYCDFPSWENSLQYKEEYISLLIDEINNRQAEFACKKAQSVYFGGGTPTTLTLQDLENIFNAIKDNIDTGAEISIEANPTLSLTTEYLRGLKALGINRISFGLQAKQDNLLKLLGRKHDFNKLRDSVHAAYSAGIENINVDIMLGVPTQSIEDLTDTITSCIKLPIKHISCYGLIVEEGTLLKQNIDSGVYSLPPPEYERRMYYTARETLIENGFYHYEVSNFAKKGFECAHNIGTWKRKPYLGFGVAAASLIDRSTRRQNSPTLSSYLKGEKPTYEKLSLEEEMFEHIMLGLRLTEGVKDEDFYNIYGVHLLDVYGDKLKPSIEKGLVNITNGDITLSLKGFDIMNTVLLDLI
ncbi:MAG: radical SAM family heme chaperone HemW [Christensenellales bacterium]